MWKWLLVFENQIPLFLVAKINLAKEKNFFNFNLLWIVFELFFIFTPFLVKGKDGYFPLTNNVVNVKIDY